MLRRSPSSQPRNPWMYQRFADDGWADAEVPDYLESDKVSRETSKSASRGCGLDSSAEDGNGVYCLPPSATCPISLPPNPDPPDFNGLATPITIEPRGQLGGSFVPKDREPREKPIDPFYVDSLNLQKQILNPGGIEVYATAAELLTHVAFVELQNHLWIAGWNPKVPNIHGLFHIGDMVVSVNRSPVSSLRQLTRGIEASREWASAEESLREVIVCSTEVKCRLRLRRMPLAKTLIACRQFEGQKLGIIFDEKGTNKVKFIEIDGPLACTGLTPFAKPFFENKGAVQETVLSALNFFRPRNSANDKAYLVPWCATEINHRPLNMFFNQHEASLLIGARGKEIAVTFQPSDFVEALRRRLKNRRSYQTYCQ